MKRIFAILLSLALLLALCACGNEENTTSDTQGETKTSVAEAVTDKSVTAAEATGDFTIKSDDGVFQTSDKLCTISAAGTYTLEGLFEGQILVEAGEEDEVILEFGGVTVTYDKDSPIKILSAGKVEISAKSDTENVIRDDRSAKKTDSEDQGEGAIYAKCDLKIKGTGTLLVNGNYNNGIHTTKDLTIQKLALKCTAEGNAIKGNDSVTVKSGTVVAISTNGDGIKTQNTDVSKNGATRGDIVISGGSVAVYAAGDGFQAARNFELTTGEDGAEPSVAIYTASYSGYTANSASTTSYKGVKAKNEVNISSGSITIQSYDDGLHADYGTSLDDGSKGKGNVNISGGYMEKHSDRVNFTVEIFKLRQIGFARVYNEFGVFTAEQLRRFSDVSFRGADIQFRDHIRILAV